MIRSSFKLRGISPSACQCHPAIFHCSRTTLACLEPPTAKISQVELDNPTQVVRLPRGPQRNSPVSNSLISTRTRRRSPSASYSRSLKAINFWPITVMFLWTGIQRFRYTIETARMSEKYYLFIQTFAPTESNHLLRTNPKLQLLHLTHI